MTTRARPSKLVGRARFGNLRGQNRGPDHCPLWTVVIGRVIEPPLSTAKDDKDASGQVSRYGL
jgi:hypothetical protein